jgi:hypothetical protein
MIRIASSVFAALALGACASQIGYHADELAEANTRFGESVRNNIAVQTVNPEGSAADITTSGARAAKAIEAYIADKVEKPAVSSTKVQQQSSGQGGQPAGK